MQFVSLQLLLLLYSVYTNHISSNESILCVRLTNLRFHFVNNITIADKPETFAFITPNNIHRVHNKTLLLVWFYAYLFRISHFFSQHFIFKICFFFRSFFMFYLLYKFLFSYFSLQYQIRQNNKHRKWTIKCKNTRSQIDDI